MAWPNVTKIKQLYYTDGNKILLQRAEIDSPVGDDLKSFFCGDGAGLMGGVIVGSSPTWNRFSNNFRDFVYHELLLPGWLANDQMVFKVLVKRKSSAFAIVERACPPGGCKSPELVVPIIDWLA